MAEMRTASLKVNLTPAIYARLKVLADRQGHAAAVLASVAVGQYVSGHMAALELDRLRQELLDLEAKS